MKDSVVPGTLCEVPEWIAAKIDPNLEIKKIDQPMASPPTVRKIYDEWFFHGPLFHGVTKISTVGAFGVFGEIKASSPGICLSETNGDEWLIDPVLLDSAMQLAGTWARQNLEVIALPTGFQSLRKIASKFSDTMYVRVFINPSASAVELSCDIAAYNQDGSLAFIMERLNGVGSKSLNRLANQTASGVHK